MPYRDSILTKLLQNALGGNSKTVMIAALSPADINYDETLSTLRYADRAKKIKNEAVINENPIDKLIRDLKEENERLKKALEQGGTIDTDRKTGMTEDEIAEMKRQMEEEIRQNLAQMGEGQSFEERLKEAQNEVKDEPVDRSTSVPHLSNLNEDAMLSGKLLFYLDKKSTKFGRKDANPPCDIQLSGLGVLKEHAIIEKNNEEFEIKQLDQNAKIKVNGSPVKGTMKLEHRDRILFGSTHLYVFQEPSQKRKHESPVTWEEAQNELAQAKGFFMTDNLSRDQQIAQEQIIELLPWVSEANAISEELDKRKSFEVVLIAAAAQEWDVNKERATKVTVKMKDLVNNNTWLWDRAKFTNRRFLMADMYMKWLEGDLDMSKIQKEEDPFWEPTEDVLIGIGNYFPQALGYALDFDDVIEITDYKGQYEGQLYMQIIPCSKSGKPNSTEEYLDDPSELLGKEFTFKIVTRSLNIKKARFSKGLFVKYKVFKDEDYVKTDTIKGTLTPEFKHTKIYHFPKITQEHLDFFENGCVSFLVYGIQEDTSGDKKLSKMTTKELRQFDHMKQPVGNNDPKIKNASLQDVAHLKSEYMLLQRKFERLEMKEKRIKVFCFTLKSVC